MRGVDNVGVGLGLDFGLVLVPEVILPVPSCEVGMMNARASCEGASAGEGGFVGEEGLVGEGTLVGEGGLGAG